MRRISKQSLPSEIHILLDHIAKTIVSLRKLRDMSQVELSRRTGISVTTINEIERRRLRNLKLSTVVKIADSLGVSSIDLLTKPELGLDGKDQNGLITAARTILDIMMRSKQDAE